MANKRFPMKIFPGPDGFTGKLSKLNSLLKMSLYINFQKIEREGAAAAAAKSLQSCPTLCDPRDGSLPGILQARTLEWVAISFLN